MEPRTDTSSLPCRHLRNKKMYIPAQEKTAWSAKSDPNASAHCWCNRTMTEIGADDRLVSLRACALPSRPCYEG